MDRSLYSEEELLKMAKQDDQRAIEDLLQKYRGFIFHLCENYYCKGAERIDLQQEAMIGFLEAIKAFELESGKMKFRNFAAICIRREIISALKRSNRKKHTILNEALSIQNIEEERKDTKQGCNRGRLWLALCSDSPESVFLEKEYLAEAGERINALLTEMERDILFLRIKGISYREITRELQLSEKAVDNAVQRIRKKMMLVKLEKAEAGN